MTLGATRLRTAGHKTSMTALVLSAAIAISPWHSVVASGRGASPTTSEWTFDRDLVGAPPPGATVFSGHWAVRAEAGAPSPPNALCQTGSAEFPALALSETVYADAHIEASFKPISGREDRAAGILFRIRDRDNYYIVRANALEDNVNIFKYVRGRRIFIKGANVKVPSKTWQRLGVDVTGARIRGSLNGHSLLEATDDTFKAGKIGLWTKADSVTCFDNVKVIAK